MIYCHVVRWWPLTRQYLLVLVYDVSLFGWFVCFGSNVQVADTLYKEKLSLDRRPEIVSVRE